MEIKKLWQWADVGARFALSFALQGVILTLLVLLCVMVQLCKIVCCWLGRFVLGFFQVVALLGMLLLWWLGKALVWLVKHLLVVAGDVLTGYESYRFYRSWHR